LGGKLVIFKSCASGRVPPPGQMRRYWWRLLGLGRHAGVSQRSTSTLIFPGKPLTSAGKRKLRYPVFNVIINLQGGIAAQLHPELDCTKSGDSSTSDLLLGRFQRIVSHGYYFINLVNVIPAHHNGKFSGHNLYSSASLALGAVSGRLSGKIVP
jgi:hypothetical protein